MNARDAKIGTEYAYQERGKNVYNPYRVRILNRLTWQEPTYSWTGRPTGAKDVSGVRVVFLAADGTPKEEKNVLARWLRMPWAEWEAQVAHEALRQAELTADRRRRKEIANAARPVLKACGFTFGEYAEDIRFSGESLERLTNLLRPVAQVEADRAAGKV
jgi:hypothetical protein